jgi:hypothetical protein
MAVRPTKRRKKGLFRLANDSEIGTIERNSSSIKWKSEDEWNNGKGTTHLLRHLMKSPNAKPPSHIYKKLGNNRRYIAWIARLRIGHCSLNQYLARFNIVDDATLPGSNGNSQALPIGMPKV